MKTDRKTSKKWQTEEWGRKKNKKGGKTNKENGKRKSGREGYKEKKQQDRR